MNSVWSLIVYVGIISFFLFCYLRVLILVFFYIFERLSFATHSTNGYLFQKKCSEYQSICKTELQPFVINGEDAAPKEFPSMASIGYTSKTSSEIRWQCGGTLISEHFVLTAANCVSGSMFSRAAVYVRLGELDSSTEEDDAHPQIYNVTERIIHPLYLVDYLHNDIALLRVGGRIEFNEYIQPACMPSAESIVSKNIVALGWGTVSPDNRIYSHLQKVQLNLVPLAKCHELYGQPEQEKLHQEIAVETQICANSSVPERDTCAGFGGGPLLNTHHKFSCLYETIGITSLGSKCGSGYPGAYTRIAAYVDWIESVVWAT